MSDTHSSLTPRFAPLGKSRDGQMRTARERLARTIEKAAKRSAKDRDLWRCRRCGRGHRVEANTLDAAHLVDEGMGGRDSVGCERKHYVSLCRFPCHREVIHGGQERMVFHPRRMGDGVVRFVAVERRIGQ